MPYRQFFLRSALLLCSLAFYSIATATFAAPTKPNKDALLAGKEGMRFSVTRVCVSGQNCQDAILAEGWITTATLDLAKNQLARWPKKADIIFNSDGGDLLAAMEFGKLIRSNQLNTRIGAPKPQKTGASPELAAGRCLSACVLSFMGGVQRIVEPADVIGFHGLIMANSDLNAPPSGNKSVSGADRAKQAMNAIGRYIESMGGDRRMVDFMLFAKGEQFQRIPFDTARQLGIDNQFSQPLNPWRLQATDAGALIALVSEKQSKGQYTVTLALTKPSSADGASGQLQLIVFMKPIEQQLQAQERQTIFADALSVKINTRQSSTQGQVISPWKANADGMQIILGFPVAAIEGLAQHLTFDLQIDFPESVTGVDRFTKFGTQSLRGAISALKK
jgi:hypothetical protein